MKKVNKKKGFTLAELLVVIAILAILVAVAVPIFTGVLGDAEQKVKDANIRAVRAAGVTAILSDKDLRKGTGPWTATATVDKNGSMGDVTIKEGSGTEDAVSNAAGGYDVTAVIQVSNITTP